MQSKNGLIFHLVNNLFSAEIRAIIGDYLVIGGRVTYPNL